MKTSITKSGTTSSATASEKNPQIPTVEELLSPHVGLKHPKVSLIHGDARAHLSSMAQNSVDLIFTDPPVYVHTTDGKTKDVQFDTSWILGAIRASEVLVFTIHPDALVAIWKKHRLYSFPVPDRIGVWTIGEEGRFRITAESANLYLAYGRHSGLQSLPDVIVAPMGDHHWPPSEFHPCPGSYHLAYWIMEHLKPKSILDPFMGSGVTLHAGLTAGCEEISGVDSDEKWVSMVKDEIVSRGISLE